jgi:molybdopterin-binding protein
MSISERNPPIPTSSTTTKAADESRLNAENPVVVALHVSDVMVAVN